MRLTFCFVLLVPAGFCAAAHAQPAGVETPAVVTQLYECRRMTTVAERVSCYDSAVDALQAAQAAREVSVVDRQQLRRARRSLFGLRLPNLGIFSDENEDGDAAVQEIETTITAAARGSNGRWVITLEDGGVWAETEGRQPVRDPEPGMPVRIRRAAVGSYFANIDGQRAIRLRRER